MFQAIFIHIFFTFIPIIFVFENLFHKKRACIKIFLLIYIDTAHFNLENYILYSTH